MKTVALLALAAGLLCSCSKKNDTPVTPAPPSPPASPTEQLDHIAKIEIFFVGDGEKEHTGEIKFSYDSQLRLVSMVERNPSNQLIPEVDGTFDYSGRTIKFVHNEHKVNSHLTQATEYVLSLDGNGKAAKLDVKRYYTDLGVLSITHHGYSYDQEGNLIIRMIEKLKSSFKWENKNLVEWTYTDSRVKDGFIQEKIMTEPRQYSTTPNRTYPDLNHFLRGDLLESIWTDHFGLRSANLLSDYTADLGTADQSVRSIKYKLDAKARPIEVESSNNGKLRYIYVITYLRN